MQLDWSEIRPAAAFVNLLACDPGYAFGPRTIRDHQFIYVVSGKGSARIHRSRYEAESGDLFYYGPDIVHAFRADEREPFTVYGLHFSLNNEYAPIHIQPADFEHTPVQDNALVLGRDEYRIAEHSRPGPWVQESMAKLLALYRVTDEISRFRSQAVLMELLASAATIGNRNDSPDWRHAELVGRIKRQLEQNAHLPYTRAWLSKLSGYHENHAARLFREHAQMSPHEYHTRQKMALARQWLLETDDTITAIAERLHYSSVHYFSRSFESFHRLPPTKFRQMRHLI